MVKKKIDMSTKIANAEQAGLSATSPRNVQVNLSPEEKARRRADVEANKELNLREQSNVGLAKEKEAVRQGATTPQEVNALSNPNSPESQFLKNKLQEMSQQVGMPPTQTATNPQINGSAENINTIKPLENESVPKQVLNAAARGVGKAVSNSNVLGLDLTGFFERKRKQLEAQDQAKYSSIRSSSKAINTDIALIKARAPGWELAVEDYNNQIQSIIDKRQELKMDSSDVLEVFLGTDGIDELVKIDNFLFIVKPSLDKQFLAAIDAPDFSQPTDPSVIDDLTGLGDIGAENI